MLLSGPRSGGVGPAGLCRSFQGGLRASSAQPPLVDLAVGACRRPWFAACCVSAAGDVDSAGPTTRNAGDGRVMVGRGRGSAHQVRSPSVLLDESPVGRQSFSAWSVGVRPRTLELAGRQSSRSGLLLLRVLLWLAPLPAPERTSPSNPSPVGVS